VVKIENFEELHEEPCDDIYCDECVTQKANDGDIEAEDEGFMVGYNNS